VIQIYQLDFDILDAPFKRMGCMAHTLQLIVKKAYSGPYKLVLGKARALVAKVRKSCVIMERIEEKCGRIVISDNSTRWNIT
jgi:hypothetical protein